MQIRKRSRDERVGVGLQDRRNRSQDERMKGRTSKLEIRNKEEV